MRLTPLLPRRLLCAALALAAAAPALAADDYPEPSPPQGAERAALFAWLDGLELPDLTMGDPVAVTRWSETVPGFVTGRDGDATHVVTLDLYEPVARPLPDDAPDDAPDWQRVTIAPLDLTEAVRSVLANSAKKRTDGSTAMVSSGDALPDRARMVVLARACAARGLAAETDALLSEASILPGHRDWYETNTHIPLRERIEDDLEHAFHVRTFACPTVRDPFPWRDAYRRFARRFPRGRHQEEAARLARVVDRMISESPSIPTAEAALALEGPARAHALALRLRTMDHTTPSVNGGPPSVFAAEFGEEPSAADHLLEMGDGAVPALIEVCDDETLTGLSFTGRGDWNPGVLTVGQCALTVLGRVAPDAGHTVAQVKTWWLRKSAPDDARALIDRIVARNAPLKAARALLDTHPDLAFWPLMLGWTMHPEDLENVAASNVWVDLLCELDDPRVPDHLARRARWGGRLTTTVGAILGLVHYDLDEALALAASKAEYLHEESHATPSRSPGRLANLVTVESESAGRLVEFCAEHDDTDVLARRFPRQWPHIKEMVVRAIVRHADDVATGDAKTILVAALTDETPFQDRHAIARTAPVAGPRVCDAAALALATRDAEQFPFTPDADEAARDAQIAAMRTVLARD